MQSGTLPSQIAQARGANVATGATYTQTVTGANDRIRAARATLANARAAEQLADRDYERTASLAQSGDVSQQSLDQARAARDQAHASVRQAQAQLTQLERADLPGQTASALANANAAHGSYQATLTGAEPQLAQAQAQARSAHAAAEHALTELREATVYSTVDGVVASFDLHPGDMLNSRISRRRSLIRLPTRMSTSMHRKTISDAFATQNRVRVQSDAGAGTFERHG